MFSSFVSLGWNCAIAASMEKFGLRSWSGPFDWIVSKDLPGLLSVMEKDFQNFMVLKNLELCDQRHEIFADQSCGFKFMHEGNLFDREQYEAVYEKYQRRIRRFLKEAERSICFLRYVECADEIDYVVKNVTYVRTVVERHSKNNQIVFLLKEGMIIPPDFPFLYFYLPDSKRNKLYDWFDYAQELLQFCVQNFDRKRIVENIIWLRKKSDGRR